jgi:hypothetical protein
MSDATTPATAANEDGSNNNNNNNNNHENVNENSPLFFPPPLGTEEEDSSPKTLEELCYEAADTGRPLHLTHDVTLTDTIRLRKRQTLTIRAAGDNHMVTISGDLHSLFLLNSSSRLILQNVNLQHTLDTDDHKQVGAAVNVRSKGSFHMTTGTIFTKCGFCVWGVQKSKLELHDCELQCPTRSSVVCFGQVTCRLHQCVMDQAGVHAICARGACAIHLEDCRISNSTARAIYAYANASVTLTNCHISNTLRADKAAIEVSAAGVPADKDNGNSVTPSSSSSSLTMRQCQVVDNMGVGIRLRGPVKHTFEENVLERNAHGNLDITEELVEAMDATLRRDSAGSSFRRGDWWCLGCRQIMVQNQCSRCTGVTKSQGRLLTVREISQLNQGIDIRSSLTTEQHNMTTTWWFDGDDEKGWIPYDEESCQQLEDVYQRFQEVDTRQSKGPLVYLSGGRYEVNVSTMEQINVESQFLRLVRRQEQKADQDVR